MWVKHLYLQTGHPGLFAKQIAAGDFSLPPRTLPLCSVLAKINWLAHETPTMQTKALGFLTIFRVLRALRLRREAKNEGDVN